MYQPPHRYTLNLHSVVYQLCLNKAGEIFKKIDDELPLVAFF